MTDFPISPLPAADRAGNLAAGVARLLTLFRSALAARAEASARNAQRRAARRAPEEVLAAHARREEARRAVDKLLLMR